MSAGSGLFPRAASPGALPYGALVAALRRFLRTTGEDHLRDPNVRCVGIGYKVTGGRWTPELAVQFTVAAKCADPRGLAALGTTPVPPTITLGGIELPTDVLQRGTR